MRSPLKLVPARKSPRWLHAFVIGTLVLATGLVIAGAWNRGEVDGRIVLNIAMVSALIVGVLSVLGWLGASATFPFAMVGLTIGYVHMVWVFAGTNDGFADLAALAGFLMLGAIGTGVGGVVDLVRLVLHVRRDRGG
jgi:hypothetical protein